MKALMAKTLKVVSSFQTISTLRSSRRRLWAPMFLMLCVLVGASLSACNTEPQMSADRGLVRHTLTFDVAPDDPGSVAARPEVFQSACDITAAVGAFQTALGTLNPNQPGSFGSGRREINWDAVPALFTNTDNFPGDFFNQPVSPRARGAVFSTPGSGFRVSDQNFVDLNGTYAEEFDFFSPVRTFIAVGDNVTTVRFFVPGSSTPATTTGFGVVFSDIDHPGSAMMRLFDVAGHNLGTYLAPACPEGPSFLGAVFSDPIVARVDIISGQAALGPESFDISSHDRGPARDLVIMDDFLYGEPIEIRDGAAASIGGIGHAR
jgi:hypothetical protein